MWLSKLEKFALGMFVLDSIVTLQGVNPNYSNEGNPIVQWIFSHGPLALLLAWFIWAVVIIKIHRKLNKPYKDVFIWVIGVSHGLAALTWLSPEWSHLLWFGSNFDFVTLSLYQIYFGVVFAIIFTLRVPHT